MNSIEASVKSISVFYCHCVSHRIATLRTIDFSFGGNLSSGMYSVLVVKSKWCLACRSSLADLPNSFRNSQRAKWYHPGWTELNQKPVALYISNSKREKFSMKMTLYHRGARSPHSHTHTRTHSHLCETMKMAQINFRPQFTWAYFWGIKCGRLSIATANWSNCSPKL